MMLRDQRALSFLRLLRLLVGLRFAIAWRRQSSVLGGLPAAGFGGLLATTLAVLAAGLLRLAAKSDVASIWLPFALTLLVFLTGLFWVLWPVLATSVVVGCAEHRRRCRRITARSARFRLRLMTRQ